MEVSREVVRMWRGGGSEERTGRLECGVNGLKCGGIRVDESVERMVVGVSVEWRL